MVNAIALPDTLSNETLSTAFDAFPEGARDLDLSNRKLALRTAAEVAMLLRAIPAHVTYLDLSGNDLFGFSVDDLQQLFQSIPPTITHLKLGGCELGEFSCEELAAALRVLPETITHLDLQQNKLDMPGDELITVFAAIPKGVQHLGLLNNNLGQFYQTKLTAEEVAGAFGSLSENVIYVQLISSAVSQPQLGRQLDRSLPLLFELGLDRSLIKDLIVLLYDLNDEKEAIALLSEQLSISSAVLAEYLDIPEYRTEIIQNMPGQTEAAIMDMAVKSLGIRSENEGTDYSAAGGYLQPRACTGILAAIKSLYELDPDSFMGRWNTLGESGPEWTMIYRDTLSGYMPETHHTIGSLDQDTQALSNKMPFYKLSDSEYKSFMSSNHGEMQKAVVQRLIESFIPVPEISRTPQAKLGLFGNDLSHNNGPEQLGASVHQKPVSRR